MNFGKIDELSEVRRARDVIRRRDRQTIAEQVEIARIPAPSGKESKRAAYVARRFGEIGLANPLEDEVGNVLGWYSGDDVDERFARQPVLVAAHLDSIFPDGTETVVRMENGRLRGPGITDNARGIAAMLAIADALRRSRLRTVRPIVFIATVGEEGLGDLRGVKHLFREGAGFSDAAAFVSLDGAGCSRIVHQAIGSLRLRLRVGGPGGHSWGDRGMPNPADVIGETIHGLRRLQPPGTDDFTITVGRIGGGTSINSIPSTAWLELDLRSETARALEWMGRESKRIFERAVRVVANASTDRRGLRPEVDQVGNRPCGETPVESVVVQAAIAATELIGEVPELTASSTDANVPISLGIPALAIGAGGRGGGVHTLGEWFENRDGALGIERALLTLVAIAGVPGHAQDVASDSTTE